MINILNNHLYVIFKSGWHLKLRLLFKEKKIMKAIKWEYTAPLRHSWQIAQKNFTLLWPCCEVSDNTLSKSKPLPFFFSPFTGMRVCIQKWLWSVFPSLYTCYPTHEVQKPFTTSWTWAVLIITLTVKCGGRDLGQFWTYS